MYVLETKEAYTVYTPVMVDSVIFIYLIVSAVSCPLETATALYSPPQPSTALYSPPLTYISVPTLPNKNMYAVF